MELYQASPEAIVRAKKVFENIYSQLNKESKNFKPSLLEKDLRNRDLRSSLDWLMFAFLIQKSALVKENVTIPLLENSDSIYRLYLTDMGIFTYQSGVNAKYFLSKEGRNTLSGIFYENYVAVELMSLGYKLYYWKGKQDAEFEYLIDDGENIIPIDVKKKKGSLKSLEKYKSHNKLKYAVKVSENSYRYDEDNKVLTLPFYYVSFFLAEFKKNK